MVIPELKFIFALTYIETLANMKWQHNKAHRTQKQNFS